MRTQETTRQTARPSTSKIWRFNSVAAAVAVALGGLAAVPGQAFAAAPNAGANIGNIATADYTDASTTPRTTTSNPVNTVVRQVATFMLTSDNSVFVIPGGQLVYPHTLTNTGNGNDTFELNVANSGGDDFNLSSLAVYADSNGDGAPDNAVNLNGTTVALARDGVFTFVVVGYATGVGSTVNGNTAETVITADSQVFEGTADDPVDVTNTDTATVTSDAVINVTKGADVITGPTGTVIEYTLTYRNTGNNTATDVTIEDVIPDPYPSATSGLDYELDTYVVGSGGLWSGSATPLTNADDLIDPAGITFKYDSGLKKVVAVVASVAPGVTGTIKFKVKVGSTTPPSVLTNTAQYNYDANGGAPLGAVGPIDTNNQNFTVLQTVAVAANDSTATSDIGGVDDINDAFAADGTTPITALNPANPGDVVVFTNEIWNRGNGTDTFNITLSGNTFPLGTTFTLYKSDGVNVLLSTDSDSIPDTGPVAAGARYTVYVKATLPTNISTTAPFTVTKTAVSNLGGTPDTVTDRLGFLAAATVDITNNAAVGGGLPNGDGPGTAAVITANTVNPGASTNFTLFINNTSAVADNYDLLADDDGTFGGVNDLPAGWTVVFHSGSCSGAVITNTGTINAGANLQVCAIVSVPANATPIVQNLHFQSKSPLTAASDFKIDSVEVNTIRNVSIFSNASGQVAPNGTVTYTHVVTNNGNVLETDVALGVSGNAFGTTLWYDVNGNGLLDSGDPVITNINALLAGNAFGGLSPNESMTIFAQVSGPSNATDGLQDIALITVTSPSDGNPADNSNTDTTTVRFGQVRLNKTQALDKNCDGDALDAGEIDFVVTGLTAKPGECIIYRVVATNEGSQPVTNVVISDTTPTYTTVSALPVPTTTKGIITTPAAGATGLVTVNDVGVGGLIMNGSEVVTATFGVKIDD